MDYQKRAEALVADIKKNEGQKADDPLFNTIQSRDHLLYLMVYTAEMIKVSRGVRRRMTIAVILLLLVLVVNVVALLFSIEILAAP